MMTTYAACHSLPSLYAIKCDKETVVHFGAEGGARGKEYLL